MDDAVSVTPMVRSGRAATYSHSEHHVVGSKVSDDDKIDDPVHISSPKSLRRIHSLPTLLGREDRWANVIDHRPRCIDQGDDIKSIMKIFGCRRNELNKLIALFPKDEAFSEATSSLLPLQVFQRLEGELNNSQAQLWRHGRLTKLEKLRMLDREGNFDIGKLEARLAGDIIMERLRLQQICVAIDKCLVLESLHRRWEADKWDRDDVKEEFMKLCTTLAAAL